MSNELKSIKNNIYDYCKSIINDINLKITTTYDDFYYTDNNTKYYLISFEVINYDYVHIVSPLIDEYIKNIKLIINNVSKTINRYYIRNISKLNVDIFNSNTISNIILLELYDKYININDIEAYKSLEQSNILSNLNMMTDNNKRDRDSIVYEFVIKTIDTKFSDNTLFLTVNYLDSIISNNNFTDTNDKNKNNIENLYKYIYICLYIAIKFNENTYIDINDLSKKLNMKNDDIIKLEKEIYSKLNGKLIYPTEIVLFNSYKYHLHCKCSSSCNKYNYAEFLIYYILINSDFILYNPSILAISSIYLNNLYNRNDNNDNTKNMDNEMEKYIKISGYTENEIIGCSYVISKHFIDHIKIKENKYDFLINKYKVDINKITLPKSLYNFVFRSTIRPKYYYKEDNIIKIPNINILLEGKLGSGSYGNVYKVLIGNDDKAVKIAFCRDDGIDNIIMKEISLLKFISNSNIIYNQYIVYGSSDGMDCDGFAMELMKLSLSDEIYKMQKTGNKFSKYLLKEYSNQLIDGVKYLHDRGIIHRDIKPDNILLRDDDLKLADFGLSKSFITYNDIHEEPAFTLLYSPPELLIKNTEYGFKADVWSVGCVIGELTKLKTLFYGNNIDNNDNNVILNNIISVFGTERFSDIIQYDITVIPINFGIFINSTDSSFIDMVRNMLEPNQYKRYSMTEISNHPWFIT